MPTKEQARERISILVDRFNEHVDEYRKGAYNEHQTRVDYINPFWKALGWDMDNEQGHAEAYRQVIHEDKLRIGSSTKAPDYCFTVYGQRKFFVDAKKPSILVKMDQSPAYQVRRYGWSAKLPIAIVTDFEEFAVYDCKIKPNKEDKASTARINYHTYKEYIREFDYLWDTFSLEAVTKGRFDKFVASDTKKRGTATVDEEFLKDIEEWRKYIATSIALNNKALNEDEINFAVQRIIDRIIFLRMCEDRGVEPQNGLKYAAEKGETYTNLFAMFKAADEKYNSGLFDLKEDRITPGLTIDNKVLKNIIKGLYYPWCEYEFSVMPADILGSVYERFLGKVIRLTPAHHAKIDEKPEVRKAGGVYYTPKYVVDYIVQNTLGKLLGSPPKSPVIASGTIVERSNPVGAAIRDGIASGTRDDKSKSGKSLTPDQVSKLRICDPACGSGSFLIGAYQYLINWHRDYYMPEFMKLREIAESKTKTAKERNDAIRKRAKLPLTPDGYLTTAEKKRILLNNIYGVDIDTQAVEVTKLNLLLKAMEGETTSSINAELTFGNQVLPNLKDNIKCGNSLIGPDFYDNQLDLFPGQMKKINAFDWKQGFPEVFKQGGFDVVIGNPPYVRIQVITENQSESVIEYFKSHFDAAVSGNFDLYVVFTEVAYTLLNDRGRLGFILPHKFFQSEFGVGLRDFLAERQAVNQIVHFGAQQVFEGATTYTCILLLTKSPNKEVEIQEIEKIEEWTIDHSRAHTFKSEAPQVGSKWNFVQRGKLAVLERLALQPMTLESITRKIFTGLQTSADSIYVLTLMDRKKQTSSCYSNSLGRIVEIENNLLKPFLLGKDVGRYQTPMARDVVVFPYEIEDGKATLMTPDDLRERYPLGWSYLEENKIDLQNREKGKMKVNAYYAYIYPKSLAEFEVTKILMPHTGLIPGFTFDSDNHYHTTNVYSLIFNSDVREQPYYFLGILNSRLAHFYMTVFAPVLRGGYINFKPVYIGPMPMRRIDLGKAADLTSHDQIVSLVDQLLSLNKQLQTAKLETDREQIQRAIDHAERKIDELVYELYGLTEEEVKVVEGSSEKP